MVEKEIRRMEEDMESQMSQTPSVKSRVDELMDQVMAEEEEEKMSMHSQSKKADDEDDEDEGENSDDSEGHNVFYKASELIVSYIISPPNITNRLGLLIALTKEWDEAMAPETWERKIY